MSGEVWLRPGDDDRWEIHPPPEVGAKSFASLAAAAAAVLRAPTADTTTPARPVRLMLGAGRGPSREGSRRQVLDAAMWSDRRVGAESAGPSPGVGGPTGRGEVGREVAVTSDDLGEVAIRVTYVGAGGSRAVGHIAMSPDQAWWLVQTLVAHPDALGRPPFLVTESAVVGVELALRRLHELWHRRPGWRLGQLLAEALWSMDPDVLATTPAAASGEGTEVSLDALYDVEDDDLLRALATVVDTLED